MAFRSAATTESNPSASGTFTLNSPAGFVAGDILLACLNVNPNGASITPPSGWTLKDSNTSWGPDGQSAFLYWKVAAGGDSFQFTNASAFGLNVQSVVTAHSGRDTSTPYSDEVKTSNSSSNASPISISLTGVTAAAGDDIVVLGNLDYTAVSPTWSFTAGPAGYSGPTELTGTLGLVGAFTKDNVSAGATGSLSMTATRSAGSGNAGWLGFVAALKVAGAAASNSNMFLVM